MRYKKYPKKKVLGGLFLVDTFAPALVGWNPQQTKQIYLHRGKKTIFKLSWLLKLLYLLDAILTERI